MIELKGKRIKIDLSNPNVLSDFIKIGEFDYIVDFDDQKIEISPTGNPFVRHFENYGDVIDDCLSRIAYSYTKHLKDDTEILNGIRKKTIKASFLDEIKYVGVMYIKKIKVRNSENMLGTFLESKNLNVTNNDIRKDYLDLKEFKNSNPFTITDDKEIDNWWTKLDDYSTFQTTNIMPTFIELLGSFNKKEHTIYICDDNINKTAEKMNLLKNEIWFSNNDCKSFKKMVVLHEIGHSVFQYIGHNPFEPIGNETRANFFASLMSFGEFDQYIKILSTYQPFIYKFPFLSFAYMINERITKKGLIKDYNELKKLYEEIIVRDIYGF